MNDSTPLSAQADTAARLARFQALYESVKDQVRRTVYSVSGAQDLDDIVQDTFLKLWKSLDSFRGDASVRSWVYRVTVNSAREHWRKQGRRRAAMVRYLDQPHPQSQAPDQDAWALGQSVAMALAKLSDAQRETVTLCYLEGLNLEECSQVLDVPLGTVKSRLHSARVALAESLKSKEGETS